MRRLVSSFDLLSPGPNVAARPHPFPGKLTHDQAKEVRRLRACGVPLAELANRFGVAKSSLSRVVHLKAHEIPGTLRLALPESERALIEELAEDQNLPVEQLAAKLLVETLRSRAW